MQLLYAQTRDTELTRSDLLKRYNEGVDQSFELLMFTLYIFMHVTILSVEDEKKKQAKHIKSEEDEAFTAKLYHNVLVQSLIKDAELEDEFIKYKFKERVDEDFFKKMYIEFAKMKEYAAYQKADDTTEVHLDILLELFRFLRKNDYFSDVLDDNYCNWMDDKSLVIGTMKKMIKDLPVKGRFYEAYYPDEETARDYGQVLLTEVGKNEAYLLTLIEPTLKNWDIDRLAIIDMILLKMALAEFLYFPTIPTKVTLNEYLEVSKQYSTPKSKDFINGILDRLMKELITEGKINKEGRGLIQ